MKPLKIEFLLITITVFTFYGNKANCQIDFDIADIIVNQIENTSFPKDTFWVTDSDARADGISDSRPFILKTIEDCAKKGGGVVLQGR